MDFILGLTGPRHAVTLLEQLVRTGRPAPTDHPSLRVKPRRVALAIGELGAALDLALLQHVAVG
jgi:hypothetical protein